MYMTPIEFDIMYDDMFSFYKNGHSIDSCLKIVGMNGEKIKRINPLYVVEALARNKELMNGEFGDIMKHRLCRGREMLLDLCEKIKLTNQHTVPKFKYNDIVWNKESHAVFFVMDYCKNDNRYYFDDVNGNSEWSERDCFERKYEKIGEVTKDVINRLLNRNKENRNKEK